MASSSNCIPNIGLLEQRKRLMFGVAAFGIGVALAVVLAALDAPRLWRISLFLPFWLLPSA